MLQPLRYLHDCSDRFRLERLPGGTCTHWKAPSLHGARQKRTFGDRKLDRRCIACSQANCLLAKPSLILGEPSFHFVRPHQHSIRSLTWDRGKELADHQRLALATEVDVYFCDPRSPRQRGSNENTNRLLRQYLPRGTDLSLHSQTKLSAIARQLNERPRKTLLYQTPADKFAECVAATS